MKVLGISALFHDAAAAIVVDGHLLAAAQEERFSRKKQDRSVPWRAARACLDSTGLSMADIDFLAYYEDPGVKLDRQLWMVADETRPEVAADLIGRIDPYRPYRALREGLGYDGPVRFAPHHMSHAASSFYFSGFEEAAILVLDAVGEWSTSSYGHGSVSSGIKLWETDRFPDSLGLFYSTITSYIGFEVNEGEYKTMGLAPLGRPVLSDRLRSMIHADNGRVSLDLRYFDFVGQRRMWSDALVELLGQPPRSPDEPLRDWHADLACSAQTVLEDIVLQKARAAKSVTGAKNLCMAGGVALNCVATARLRASGLFEDVFVPPAAGDAGGSVGAAAQVSWDLGVRLPVERLEHAYFGPAYTTEYDVIPVLDAACIPFSDYRQDSDALIHDVIQRLAGGQIIGWFQGRMEFGPRALGARSILADPRLADMRDRINSLVKMRESFRPFAPSVLSNVAPAYFSCDIPMPFMLETVRARVDWLPAVTHVDGSARIQTVDSSVNPRFASLLEEFGEQTGCAVLLNTSFNQRGEPIVCTPVDAIECFVRSRLDALVLEDVVIDAKTLPASLVAAMHKRQADRRPSGELAIYELI
jgi:carbamoyltransferase